MSAKKGFTLMEILVVLIIIGILVRIALPNYLTYTQQEAAKAAQNNLITIYNAEKNFYFTNGYYCSTSTQNTTCADNLTDLNNPANLALNITDNYFTYACSDPLSGSDSNLGTSFACTATTTLFPSAFSLTIQGGTANTPTPVVLTGATTCATPAGAGCNPVCNNLGIYCP